ncbi:MAG TPA: NAD-dependent epimerase/dehydratase family protein [Acidimicrobiales bacterium]
MARFLILGGTGFVGRHITEAALAAGHDVTLFNRGKTNPDAFAGAGNVTTLVGDRQAGGLDALRGTGEWDACVDVNAYVPRVVREAVDALAGRVGHYTYISTVSVYEPTDQGPVDEDFPTQELDEPDTENVDNDTYGPLKRLCEEVALEAFPANCTVVRPGIVAGPYDPTDRFTYWVRRAAQGGEMLVPNRPDQPVQVVHARDQGDFVVKASVDRVHGLYNSVGPTEPLTFEGLIAACCEAAGTSVSIEWVDEDFLREEKAGVPLYVPSAAGMDGLFQASSERARALGLVNRPIAETAADTLAWDRTRDQSQPIGGMSPERERELLTRWREGRA